MKKELFTAIRMMIATTVLLGLIYPLAVTGIAQLIFPKQANGSLIVSSSGQVTGSSLLAQPFGSPQYFHPRPSAAGANGYDPTSSSGSYLGPTNKQLIDRVNSTTASLHAENSSAPVPIDLVTTSGSGLDPEISPAAAEFQVPRVARERRMSEDSVRELVRRHTLARQWGFLGEPGVNVLELNLDLDRVSPAR
ncbi:MAG TPA: potassium-transporting ATPase subunit KdpC [Candidatus Acidoferrales bacterium]|nr:potassium-transporting ATPase subunit KdpC [Candidatus Acidoferrales bacterium]